MPAGQDTVFDLRARLAGLHYLLCGRVPAERRFLADILRLFGASRIREAATPDEAAFESQLRPPDMVVWASPSSHLGDVAHYLQRLREEQRKVPPIILTCGGCTDRFLADAMRLGLAGILVRPFNPDRLASHMARALWRQGRHFEIE